MEPEVQNVTATSGCTSGGHDTDVVPSSALLLWVPHVSIGLVLLVLVLLSFVRFHSKHGHRYRKSSKGPRPAWQELGMSDFLWQMQQRNNPGAGGPASQACQLYQGCVLYYDAGSTVGYPASGPSSASECGPPTWSDFGPTLTLLPSPNSVQVHSDVGTSSPDSGTGSVFNSRPELSSNSGPTSLPYRQYPDVLPNFKTTSLTNQGLQDQPPIPGLSSLPNPDPSSSPKTSSSSSPNSGLSSSTNLGAASSSNPGPSSSTNLVASSPKPGPSSSPDPGQISMFEMSTSIRTQDPVPAATSSENCGSRTEVTTFASDIPHAPRPSFIWTLGTDRVTDSSSCSIGQESPRVKDKGVWNASRQRNRAGSEVVLRSTGPQTAITTVALSSADDKESLLTKSPL